MYIWAAKNTLPPFCPDPHLRSPFFRVVPVPMTPLFNYARAHATG